MGTIIIKVPQELHEEYEIDNLEVVAELLHTIKRMQKQQKMAENALLTGLFSDEAALMDQITELAMPARENHPLRRRSE